MDILIDLSHLTDALKDLFDSELGKWSWAEMPGECIAESIAYLNATGLTAALDFIIDQLSAKGLHTLETQRRIDQFFELYTQTFEEHALSHDVAYDRRSNSALLVPKQRGPQPDFDFSNLKDEHTNALERSDFFPERLRRAFEELCR